MTKKKLDNGLPKETPKQKEPAPDPEGLDKAMEMEPPRTPGSIRAERLLGIEKVLTEAGWPPMSPKWHDVLLQVCWTAIMHIIGEFGRRAGKSSTLCGKWIPCELTPELHQVPPGDVGFFAIISADKDQAQERLDTVHKALVALNVPHRKTANEILLTECNLGVKCFAATTSAVVAFTCIGFLCDEMAMWTDKDSGANPARKIIEALRPTMATMPNAKGWYVSASWSDETLHAEMVDAGTTKSQLAFKGTTPEFNPTLTDEKIRLLEPDEPTRRRAYYNERIAQGETSFFPWAYILAASKTQILGIADKTSAGGDFAFKKNSSAVSVASSVNGGIRVESVEERIPGKEPLKPSATMRELVGMAQVYGADSIAADLHYFESLREVTEEFSIPLVSFPSDADGISQAYIRFRVKLSEGLVDLTQVPERVLKQLKNTKQKPGDGAVLKIIHPTESDGSHGDCAASLICATWLLEQEGIGDQAATGPRRFSRGDEPSKSGGLTMLPTEEDMN